MAEGYRDYGDTPAALGGLPPKPKRYLEPIDGLRFVCAAWVVLSHITPPIDGLPWLIQKAAGVLFNGAWAVIAFFVISGLCIHYPYAAGKTLRTRKFYLSRALRIALPMFVAIGIAAQFENGIGALEAVLWSLYCEMLYYVAYPFLRRLFRTFGTLQCAAAAFVLAAAITFLPDQHSGSFWSYGTIGTALLGLPIWISGCFLAELISEGREISLFHSARVRLYLRLTILTIGIATMALHFHTPLKYKYTFLVSSPMIVVWLYSEIQTFKDSAVLSFLGHLGSGSYSLYLTHKLSLPIMAIFSVGSTTFSGWAAYMLVVAALSTFFFYLVEQPSHRLAKKLS